QVRRNRALAQAEALAGGAVQGERGVQDLGGGWAQFGFPLPLSRPWVGSTPSRLAPLPHDRLPRLLGQLRGAAVGVAAVVAVAVAVTVGLRRVLDEHDTDDAGTGRQQALHRDLG